MGTARETSEAGGSALHPFLVTSGFGLPVCRLSLASYGRTAITPDDVLSAVDRGINFLNWQGLAEGASDGDAFTTAIMIRYNAAHRGAERDVFPVTQRLGLPVIAYTALRWGALLRTTPDDPAAFSVPRAPDWYRFVLQQPAVAVTLSAPQTRAELDENLRVLKAEEPLTNETYAALAEHG